jgi:hypothetical protein
MYKPLSNVEIRELLSATLHGSLPKETQSRVFASLAELSELRAATEKMLKHCYPCNGTGRLSADFDFAGEGKACGACYELRQAFKGV